jgi:tRNA 2-thiocytidine biosynthesis protein TtcA
LPRMFPRMLYHLVGRAISDFGLIEAKDVVMVGISGGKDSMLLATLLAELHRRAPVRFDLLAVTVDPGGEYGFRDEDVRKMESFFADQGVPYTVVRTEIAKIIQAHPTKDTACSLCANLRRGALHKTAQELGANKVALGHHLDDAIETLFLNMFYQGSLRCFHPKTYLSRRNVTVIRPLVYVPEEEIVKANTRLDIPVIEARCPLAGHTLRQSMKERVTSLSGEIPGFRSQMRGALGDLWLPKQKV